MKSFFAKNLKALRKYHKISLEGLSEAINVSKSAISDYENEKFSPSIFICRNIAEHFGTSIDNMEYSDILEIQKDGVVKISDRSSASLGLAKAQEEIAALHKIIETINVDLKLKTQKIESLELQKSLQDQLKESKFSEIVLLKTQIKLLEEKIKILDI